jgi:hypothetical protein
MPRSTYGRHELRAQVAHELRSLGSSKDEVAQRLEAAGVRGTPSSVSDCAIAVYLSAVVASDARVDAVLVGDHRVFIKLDGRWRLLGTALPKPLRRFVADFDRQRYPALVRPTAEVGRTARCVPPDGAHRPRA